MNEWKAAGAGPPGGPDDGDGDETIELLHEEILRLEAELRARGEASPAEASAAAPPPADDGLRRRVEQLGSELSARDEMVALLLDQARALEEAAAARQAEWDQLDRWLGEVERRVDDRDARDARLRAELDAERAASESLRRRVDAERQARERDRERERKGYERDAERPRDAAGAEAGAVADALREENHRLRDACARLERSGSDEAEALRRRLAGAEADLAQARDELRHALDEAERERERAALEAAAARARPAPVAPAGDGDGGGRGGGGGTALEGDHRIRALREHLQQIHEFEAGERARQKLSARLARLWRRTGPGV